MKTIATLASTTLVLLTALGAEASWTKQSGGMDGEAHYTTGSAAGSELAIAAGYKSGGSSVTKLFKRTTDGNTWLPGTTDAIAFSSEFLSESTAFLGGMTGNVFRSDDAGQSWFSVPEAAVSTGGIFDGIPVMDIVVSQDNTSVMAVGSDGTISLSMDSGATWTVTAIPLPSEDLSLSSGAIIGDRIWLLGGKTAQAPVEGDDFNDPVPGIPASDGFVLLSENGGASFDLIFSGFSHDFIDVSFVNPMEGWAAASTGEEGSAAVARTDDGGKTWDLVSIPELPQSEVVGANLGAVGTLASCNRVEFFGRLVGVALCSSKTYDAENGSNGLYLTDDGGNSWKAQVGYKDLFDNIFTAGNNIHDLAMSDCHTGWLIGQGELIARWDNEDQQMDCEAGGAPEDSIPEDLAGGRSDEDCGCFAAGSQTSEFSLLETVFSLF